MEEIILDKSSSQITQFAKLIQEVSWGAGKYLANIMINNQLSDFERVIVLTNQNELVGFAALLKEDIVKDTGLTPFISTVFVAEKYRGKKLSQKLVSDLETIARQAGFSTVYIATAHIGLYEKIGYQHFDDKLDIMGRPMRLLKKQLTSAN